MKGWIVKKPLTIEREDISRGENNEENLTKVKITKCLLTISDVLTYNGTNEQTDFALGSYGTGIVSESSDSTLTPGTHVYVRPYIPCNECNNCQNGAYGSCSDMKVAGVDYDGFLRDFTNVNPGDVFQLPESVSDLKALFIDYISLAVSIVDKLHVEKGDYVSVVGANYFGIILSQILIYYQAVPILCTQHEDSFKMAKDSGIYYVLGDEDNWQKEVLSITGGRMTSHVVYMANSDIPIVKAFSLASYGAKVIYTGESNKNTSFSFHQAVKKQLEIVCVNNGYDNTEAAINLLANDAVDISRLKINCVSDNDVKTVLDDMNKTLLEKDFVHETVVETI